MSANFWTYDEFKSYIEEHDRKDILHFRIETAKLGVDIVKLQTDNEAFKQNQLVYRIVDRTDGVLSGEHDWKMAEDWREVYKILVRQFQTWWNLEVDLGEYLHGE